MNPTYLREIQAGNGIGVCVYGGLLRDIRLSEEDLGVLSPLLGRMLSAS